MVTLYKRIGHNLHVMQQSVCLVFNIIMVDSYASFVNCTPVGRASDLKLFILVGWGTGLLVCCLALRC